MRSSSSNEDQCLFCGKTEAQSTDIDWVQCSACMFWAHFSCAGVDQEIAKTDWHCPQCVRSDVQQLRVSEPSTKRRAKKSGAKGDAGSDQGAGSAKDPSEQQSEEEQLMRETFAKQMEARKAQLARKKALLELQMQQEWEMREQELQFQREMEELQLEQERKVLDKQLAAEKEFLRKRNAIRREIDDSIQRVHALKDDAAAVAGTVGGVSDEKSKQKVTTWLKEKVNTESVVGKSRGAIPKSGLRRNLTEVPRSEKQGTEGSEVDSDESTCGAASEKNARGSIHGSNRTTSHGPGRRVCRISRDQLAARKAVSHSLPKFRGEPEVWPLFISSFEYTTEACGFSNLENLKRLQDCLMGDALEAVRSRLVMPDSVPDVIQDLRNLFGKPEKLLKTLLVKFRNAPSPRPDRLETFFQFGITVKQLCDHLEAARLQDHLTNPMLVQELVDKLPPSYKLDWVRYKRNKVESPLRMFTNFINEIVSDVSEVEEFTGLSISEYSRSGRGNPKKREFVLVHESEQKRNDGFRSESSSKACWICKRSGHLMKFCDQFRRMNIAERLSEVEKQNLCERCLQKHGNGRCVSRMRCTVRNCQGNHHPLLHRVEESIQLQKAENGMLNGEGCSIIFRMMQVTLYVGNRQLDTVAFLDEGSSATLVDDLVASLLKAEGMLEPLIVTWTSNINRIENHSRKVELMISARGSKEKFPLFNTRTVSELQLPKQHVRFADVVKRYKHLAGIPVEDDPQSLPTILVGLDNLYLFAPLESRVGKPSEPIAVRSRLGWTIYGSVKRKACIHTYLNLHSVKTVSNQGLQDMIRDQYMMEETAVTLFTPPEPAHEKRAREILEATTKRVGDRFETGLLWKEDTRRFPDSFPMAVRRMRALQRKLEKDPALDQNVKDQIEEYQAKGYAHKITAAELVETASSTVWYLPMNVVVNPRKPSKVRLVWDAAASVGGISLNSELLKGPDMLVPLPKVVCGFREGPVAFGGDIQEMYHQIKIVAKDKQALRFLFGTDPTGAPQTYVMDVATFGATCSPCSAQFVKNLNAQQFATEFPEAAAAILNKHYVDDYYDSADTIDEAIRRANEVKHIHARGGFHIRNWVSNSKKFLEELGERNVSATVHFSRDKGTEYERVLGIVWEPVEDIFCFATVSKKEFLEMVDGREYPTKRTVLSFVMAQFDPMGFLAPITVCGKMLIQDLWRTGCDWDTKIDTVSFQKWLRLMQMMRSIGSFKLPRSYFGSAKSDEVTDLQLHIFADASETAYGCVAYFRAVVRGEVTCTLVMSRSKVAPLKQISIPRLELLAAVLGARLSRTVVENHNLKIEKVVYWIDASVVLSWIRSDQRRYKQFVGFRIGELLSLTKISDWRWVPTRLNVADQLTKWGKDPEMHPDSAWVRGPAFLYKTSEEWPKRVLPPANTTEELRVHLLLHDVRVVDELKVLSRNKDRPASQWMAIEKTSPLYKLTPLIDERGLIRMEGRVERADFLPFNLRFPVILPSDHRITRLIVQHYHEKSGHGYRQAVKNELKQLYYIPHVDAVVRKVSSLCIWCRVNRNRPQVPRMAPLPVQRLTPNLRPFSYVGVDYLGPIEVTVLRRKEKRWIALFTCLVTRSVHLEVSHGLTTQSCLMAIHRFIGRRGWPAEFFSDNGTNLRGASKEIVETVRSIGDECADQITNAKTKWSFNPPAAPHMGGVWERLVRSVKEALTTLNDGRRLTDEVLGTTIVNVEDIINSRPLTYVSQESSEAEALTPNHFLRGASPNLPCATFPQTNPAEALRDAFQRSQQLTDMMWRRWIKEYVPSLNQRTKWFGETHPLRAGDLVYVVDGNNRKCWIRGVVEKPIVSGDGRIRQAWVRTKNGRFKRATARLAVMEISEGNSDPDWTSGAGLRAGECSGHTGEVDRRR
ncbi:uncharacterized protein LOC128740262 [Sabethes cyaneus]|uniref:uncharacterized protein LOC128740262 n=1 Tax=Sabethes cyaneus TaxID=53552 RepID=UPI00237DEA69|nr:uncharacterized protein LOC128740262 [Sabethes cyaneus]